MSLACITPSFNKNEYVLDAINSVLNQTYKDFTYWIIENSTELVTKKIVRNRVRNDRRVVYVSEYFTPAQRKAEYPTAVILNKYLQLINADIIMYLSDDDIFTVNTFQKVITMFENPSVHVCYFSMTSVSERGGSGAIGANMIFPQGTNMDCRIDGGQVAFRRNLLDQMKKPYFETDYGHAAHCDGLFLNKLSALAAFSPINDMLLTHRRTRKSTFVRE